VEAGLLRATLVGAGLQAVASKAASGMAAANSRSHWLWGTAAGNLIMACSLRSGPAAQGQPVGRSQNTTIL